MRIHPSAIVDPTAEIHSQATVGPYCIVEGGVRLGQGVVLQSHVVVYRGTSLGEGTYVSPNAVLGGAPQSLDFDPAINSGVQVGPRCMIRESVTIHRAVHEGDNTRIGEGSMLMANSHVGHDCTVGNGVIITSYAGISGHCIIGDYAVIGGFVGVHQKVRIGTMAMIAGWSRVSMDCPPYMISAGVPCQPHSLNLVALKRRGVSAESRSALKSAHRILYRSEKNTSHALERIRQEVPQTPEVEHLLAFIGEIADGAMGRGLGR
ncbi:MAG: acyl-ACP--UDP-N-acetylglucosamine O-acyltransferase [Armatimonadia bacterium]|nr:acyl-ACP--UDP-N-acetylglucosamine O-acyltransferase [Armatimonadia bacterium]